ncbi:ERCC1 DNA excision repair protein ERCC-1 [Candida maltosa Xu316]
MAKAVTRAENEALSRATKPQARVIGPSEVLVSPTQKGNILLSNSKMKTTAWRFDKSVLCDYYINPTFQILFLSLKLHKLRPEYIDFRWQKFNKGSTINTTKKDNTLRVLLVVVDIEAHQEPLRYLSDFCIKHDLSLVLAWSFEEAGNYIALSKEIDDTPAKAKKSVQGTRGADYNTSVVEAFTGIKSVNKTDVSNLLANCKSVKEIILQSCKEDNDDGVGLANIPGLGATKLTNLKQVFSEPFITNKDYNK